MSNGRGKDEIRISTLLLMTVLFLFFFQSLAELIEAIYALCLLQLAINGNVAGLAFLLSPLLLVMMGKRVPSWALYGSAVLTVAGRLAVPFLPMQGKLLAAGIAVASFMVFITAITQVTSSERDRSFPARAGQSLAMAVLLSVFLRTVNSTVDLSLQGWGNIPGIMMGAAALAALPALIKDMGDIPGGEGKDTEKGILKAMLSVAGLFSIVALLFFVFTSPTVIARWSGLDYAFITGGVAVMLLLYVTVELKGTLTARLGKGILLLWNILFVVSLVAAVLVHQISFPPNDSSLYPLFPGPLSWIHQVPPVLVILLFPVLFVDAVMLAGKLTRPVLSLRGRAVMFTLGGFLLIVFLFLQILSSVWGYIEPVSPWFRERYYVSLLVPGIFLLLSMLSLTKEGSGRNTESWQSPGRAFAAAAVLLASGTIIALAALHPRPVAGDRASDTFRVLSYNIQQGVNASGEKDYDGQLEFIRSLSPDIVAIQENDTVRVSGGNRDVLRYFAEKLGYYSYYGPSSVLCTYGVGVLSRFPLENTGSFHMASDVDQNAATEFTVTVKGRTFSFFNNHPAANSDRVRLMAQEQFLKRVKEKENCICAGDYNFTPSQEPYSLTIKTFRDAWLLRWPVGADDAGLRMDERIDHIFLSPGIRVKEVRYVKTDTTDHPALWADIYVD